MGRVVPKLSRSEASTADYLAIGRFGAALLCVRELALSLHHAPRGTLCDWKNQTSPLSLSARAAVQGAFNCCAPGISDIGFKDRDGRQCDDSDPIAWCTTCCAPKSWTRLCFLLALPASCRLPGSFRCVCCDGLHYAELHWIVNAVVHDFLRYFLHAMSADAKKPARGGRWKSNMEHSARAQDFLRSLNPEGLKVGDGSDHLPVWIGIDAEAEKVYKVYASGLATGFGDGQLSICNGLKLAPWRVSEGAQVTARHQVVLSGEVGLRVVEAEAVVVKSPSDPLSHDGGLRDAVPITA